jgi:hypothetical protein
VIPRGTWKGRLGYSWMGCGYTRRYLETVDGKKRVVPRGCANPHFGVLLPLPCLLSRLVSSLSSLSLLCLALLSSFSASSAPTRLRYIHLSLQCCSLSLIHVGHLHHFPKKREKTSTLTILVLSFTLSSTATLVRSKDW